MSPTSRTTVPVTAGAVAVSGTIWLKSTGSGLNLGLKPSYYCFYDIGQIISLCFSFPMCKMELLTVSTVRGFNAKCWEQCLTLSKSSANVNCRFVSLDLQLLALNSHLITLCWINGGANEWNLEYLSIQVRNAEVGIWGQGCMTGTWTPEEYWADCGIWPNFSK